MDGVNPRQWRIRKGNLREIIREEHHTRESIPADLIAVIQELERFAKEAAEQVNRCNADLLAARQEIADLNGRLKAVEDHLAAILAAPNQHGLAPMSHYHDTKAGVQAA